MKTALRVGIRAGAWLCGALVIGGCSGKTVDLGGRNQIKTDGGGAATGSGGAGGTGGADAPEGGINCPACFPGTGGSTGGSPDLPGITHTSKVDLLLMVDNSASMADKQKVLKSTIPDLVNRITSAASGVTDLHVGVISSSLGDHGAHTACNGDDTTGNLKDEENDDHGHLITTRPRAASLGLPPVITWDPTQSPAILTTQIQDVVTAVGEFGCGFEAQLESVYRFLVDPNPPLAINKAPCPGSTQQCAYPTGKDDAVIAQRVAFLRPDSAVVIALLTDENDCSIKDTQQFFYATLQDVSLPRGSAVCVTNPNDKCCYPCSGSPPSGCPADPTCTPAVAPVSEQALNLRCFNDKQRFGIDFLYPVQRYVTAFTRQHLCTSRLDLVPDAGSCPDANKDGLPDIMLNPLFSNGNNTPRDASMIYVLGMVGVPWQDLAVGGASATELRFKTPSQMASDGTWNAVLGAPLGNPETSPPIFPTDGLMVESRSPRNGNDVTGAPIPGPSSTLADDNAINHHDWADGQQDDLMYACIFPLLETRNCPMVEAASPYVGCDCGVTNSPGDNNPLCQAPDGTYGPIQYFAKAYPGIRELSLLKAMGNQGLPASICPKNLTDDTQRDYGYRPAIDSLLIQLKQSVP